VFFRQVLHGVLNCFWENRVGVACVVDYGVTRQANPPGRGDDPTNRVAEQVAITRDRHGGGGRVLRNRTRGPASSRSKFRRSLSTAENTLISTLESLIVVSKVCFSDLPSIAGFRNKDGRALVCNSRTKQWWEKGCL
jgi:hypothetical protein